MSHVWIDFNKHFQKTFPKNNKTNVPFKISKKKAPPPNSSGTWTTASTEASPMRIFRIGSICQSKRGLCGKGGTLCLLWVCGRIVSMIVYDFWFFLMIFNIFCVNFELMFFLKLFLKLYENLKLTKFKFFKFQHSFHTHISGKKKIKTNKGQSHSHAERRTQRRRSRDTFHGK